MPRSSPRCQACGSLMFATAMFCPACGTLAGTRKTVGSARAGGGQLGQTLLPNGLTAEQNGDCLTLAAQANLVQTGFIPVYFMGIALMFLIVAALGFLGLVTGSTLLVSTIPHVFVVGLIGVVGYVLANTFLNRMTMEITPRKISRRIVGPVPWPNILPDIATESIVQVYVVERRSLRRRSRLIDDDEWLRYTYDVNLALKSGGRRRLLTSHDPSVSRFIEERIEQHLGIRNVPVVSQPYQTYLLWESTDDDGTDRGRHPAALSPRSFPVSLPVLAGLIALGVFFVLPGICMVGGVVSSMFSRRTEKRAPLQVEQSEARNRRDRAEPGMPDTFPVP